LDLKKNLQEQPKFLTMTTYSKHLEHYILLANLFVYPTAEYKKKVQKVQHFLDTNHCNIGEKLSPFTRFVENESLEHLEELYTRSFEVQAITTLDLGYLLFGDDYKRAELLVNLNREHNEVDNHCGDELPDHLPNVLRLIPKLKDKVLLDDIIKFLIAPALMKILDEFKPERLDAKNKVYKKHHKTIIEFSSNALIYQKPIDVVMDFVSCDFNIKSVDKAKKTSSFLGSLNQEMELEN